MGLKFEENEEEKGNGMIHCYTEIEKEKKKK